MNVQEQLWTVHILPLKGQALLLVEQASPIAEPTLRKPNGPV
jgi:hypothetical protein